MLAASDNHSRRNDNSGSWLCLPSTRQKQIVGKPDPLPAGPGKATVHLDPAEIPPGLHAHHDAEAGHQQLELGGPHPAPQSHGWLCPERAGSWSLQLLIKPGFPPKGGMAAAGPLGKCSPHHVPRHLLLPGYQILFRAAAFCPGSWWASVRSDMQPAWEGGKAHGKTAFHRAKLPKKNFKTLQSRVSVKTLCFSLLLGHILLNEHCHFSKNLHEEYLGKKTRNTLEFRKRITCCLAVKTQKRSGIKV